MANNETPLKEPPYIRRFSLILIFLGCLGGFLALTVPLWKSLSNIPVMGPVLGFLSLLIPASDTDNKYPESKAIADLRLHILYITGGIIAILTLLQTSWKNQVDRHKVEADIQKNEQDAKNEAAKREQDAVKSERDHIRQVHAERRSRYTKAVEQLASEKATVRLGGIYTLVGLVDEWLADESLTKDKQKEEGQVIINNLCSYIRSPFPLAEKIDECEARKELEELKKKEPKSLRPIDSSQLRILNARFADSNDDKKIEQITADYAKIQEEQDVRRTIFVEMSKRSSTFTKKHGKIIETIPGMWSAFDFDFTRAPIFYPLNALTVEKGNFSSAKFYSDADFGKANFTQNAYFSGATFARNADFKLATFTSEVSFSGATFTRNADFMLATFTRNADFKLATFTGNASFSGATFTSDVSFSGVTFARSTGFLKATFTQNADFWYATFISFVDFSDATFRANSPKFVAISEGVGATLRARFAAISKDYEAHKFTISKGSFDILLGEAELDGVKYRIPVGTVLFDPSSEKTSEPAKPLDNSDKAEENKTE